MGKRKNQFELEQLRTAGRVTAEIIEALRPMIVAGTSAGDVERRAWELCREHGVQPTFYGYEGYKYATCIGVNDEVVHSIPYDTKVFSAGDLVKVDFGAMFNGYCADHCRTFGVGTLSDVHARLLAAGKAATDNAVALAIAGNRIGDLSHAMQSTAEEAGFSVVKTYIGHGIGKKMHEPPEIPAFGHPGTGEVLQDGMVLCIECQVCEYDSQLESDRDGWTTRTRDGGYAVMFEQMVHVTANGPEIFTPYPGM